MSTYMCAWLVVLDYRERHAHDVTCTSMCGVRMTVVDCGESGHPNNSYIILIVELQTYSN